MYFEDVKLYLGVEILIEEGEVFCDCECMYLRFCYLFYVVGFELYCWFDLYVVYDEEFFFICWELFGVGDNGDEEFLEYFELIEFEWNLGFKDSDFDFYNVKYDFNFDWVMEL